MNRFFKWLGILTYIAAIIFGIGCLYQNFIEMPKATLIGNDPNDWADEVGNPRHILDLLLSIVNVSVQTVDILAGLPGLDFGEWNRNS